MHAGPQEASLTTALQTFVNGPITQNAPDTVVDCYVAILTRTTRLEQSMVAAPHAPPIDLVLEAERDLRALKQRLFACVGHAHNGRDCLASDRPVLLSLSLLAERVVTMLEQTFRLAAGTASTMTMNPTIRD
ncbi:hypothetical protein DL771_002727 [Monosporascus sp. 5C6A]|nr:hypothetical protein DL771_002727 [Monosporascus sp. 5C6A]